MQTIFGAGVATGRFAMGSGEALGIPAEQETIDMDNDAPEAQKDEGPVNKGDKKGRECSVMRIKSC